MVPCRGLLHETGRKRMGLGITHLFSKEMAPVQSQYVALRVSVNTLGQILGWCESSQFH